jgi:hypothetical protein
MYHIISSLGAPIIIINAVRNYFAWKSVTSDEVEQVYKRQIILNGGIAASIFFTGIAAVYTHAMKFQKPTPLIISAMVYRIVAIALISFATVYSGAAVNHWCYDRFSSRSP